MRRVAVTGIGVVSPLGHTADAVFQAARAGSSAIRVVNHCFATQAKRWPAAPTQFDGALYFEPAKLRMLDRVSQFGVVAAQRALADSRLDLAAMNRERIGVFVGTGMGSSQTMDAGYRILYGERSDRIMPLTVLMGMHNSVAAWIGLEMQLPGPTLTYSTACSSSAVAIGEAWSRLRRGELDVAIAGGAEAPLSFGSLIAWDAMRTLARIDESDPNASCKPFAKNRCGMVLAEGSAIVFLEGWEHALERGATILGEVVGYGLATDTAHIARPSVAGQAAAMQAALRSANMDASLVDAINAHGTGTQANDAVETAAIRTVFGIRANDIPISATKAVHGHLLGAAGAFELVLSILALRHQVALPTMHLVIDDPECDLDYVPRVARQMSLRAMLSNSFAFGGTNAVLALRVVDRAETLPR
jgi:3-oxoacyl-[acyl-carrier-protein] synthase II